MLEHESLDKRVEQYEQRSIEQVEQYEQTSIASHEENQRDIKVAGIETKSKLEAIADNTGACAKGFNLMEKQTGQWADSQQDINNLLKTAIAGGVVILGIGLYVNLKLYGIIP
ncbi:hypothetical protein HN924_01140 [Candidatus Woesearchaeota archaeon]|jgi:hypothetical protein|nr:hypothetical protein [Candidatus Woesearchaeota archaeon]MBT7062553.1 hypothetical protein [Candidatus Woesearchaeota archaeon]